MKKVLRMLTMFMVAAVMTSSLAATAIPAQASVLAGSKSKKISVTLYADFSFGNPDNDGLIKTKSATVESAPVPTDLTGLLSEWTGLKFFVNKTSANSDEIHIDWSKDSTLLAGLDDIEQDEEFTFDDAESLRWFMMDSLYLTLINNLGKVDVYYSVDGKPLAWGKGEMTGLTELPIDQPYMGSAFYFTHVDVKGDVTLEDESDAYDYLYEEMADVMALGFDLELYGEDEVDGDFCWEFFVTYEQADGSTDYMHLIAMTESGAIYIPDAYTSGYALMMVFEPEPSGMYYHWGEKDDDFIRLEDGDVVIETPFEAGYDSIRSGEGAYAIFGQRLYLVIDADDETYTASCFFDDKDTIYARGNGQYERTESGRPVVNLTNEDDALDYMYEELDGFSDIFMLRNAAEGELDGEVCWIFSLNYTIDTEYGFDVYKIQYLAVTESGGVYMLNADIDDDIEEIDMKAFVKVEYPGIIPDGIYYYDGDTENESLVFEDGCVAIVPGNDYVGDADIVEAECFVYGNMLYIVFEEEEGQIIVVTCVIGDKFSIFIGEDEGYYKEKSGLVDVNITDEDEAYEYLCGAMQNLFDAGFYLEFFDIEEADGEECWAFALLWEDTDGSEYIEDYYAAIADGTLYIWDFDEEDWLQVVFNNWDIEGEYYYDGDEDDDSLSIDKDGSVIYTVIYTDEEDVYFGNWAVFGEYFYILIEADGEYQVGVFHIENEDSLMIDDEDGFYSLED